MKKVVQKTVQESIQVKERFFNDNQRQEIIRLFSQEGLSRFDIAEKLKLNVPYVTSQIAQYYFKYGSPESCNIYNKFIERDLCNL